MGKFDFALLIFYQIHQIMKWNCEGKLDFLLQNQSAFKIIHLIIKFACKRFVSKLLFLSQYVLKILQSFSFRKVYRLTTINLAFKKVFNLPTSAAKIPTSFEQTQPKKVFHLFFSWNLWKIDLLFKKRMKCGWHNKFCRLEKVKKMLKNGGLNTNKFSKKNIEREDPPL